MAHHGNISQGISKNISQNMSRIREAAGMTQRDLGMALGYPEQHAQTRISQYETGKRSPGKRTLGRIATILHIPVEAFFQQTAEPGKKAQNYPAISELDREIQMLCEEGRKYGVEDIKTLRKMLPIMFGKKKGA